MNTIKRICLAAVVTLGPAAWACAEPTVILLHGLARSANSMSKLEDALREAGYATCNIDYPSTEHPVDTLAKDYVLPKIEACVADETAPVDFVTHSMGGILLRKLRDIAPDLEIGKAVMLGPPNRGSELVDNMGSWALFEWVNGPAGQQLGTGPESVPNKLGPADFDLGVIAGNEPFLEPFKGYIDAPSDGKVSVESTKLEGMTDHIVLPVTHSLMMRDQAVIEQTLEFLKKGQFAPAPDADTAIRAP